MDTREAVEADIPRLESDTAFVQKGGGVERVHTAKRLDVLGEKWSFKGPNAPWHPTLPPPSV